MTKSIDERIAAELERRAKADARLEQLTAQKKTEERKRETRRQFLVGEAVLSALSTDAILADRVKEILQQSISKPRDKEVLADLLRT